jgi:stage II sporulation protein AA (anti-sigma F factor antagonist)
MEVVMTTEQDCLIIDVCGEVDMYAAPDFYESYCTCVQRHAVLPVIVNIEKATYMDSSGIGVLFKMFADAKSRNVRFLVCGARGMVASLFELSKMNSILPRAESVRSARMIIGSVQ